jgi:glycosyltransferase involved in cell wall biosynthesis
MLKFFFKPYRHIKHTKKIIHITRFFGSKSYGGIQEVIKQLSNFYSWEHEVLSIGSNNFERLNKNLLSRQFEKTLSIFDDFFSLNLLKYLIKKKNSYNVIVIHYPHLLALFYIFFLPFKKKVIIFFHSEILRSKIFYYPINLIILFFNQSIFKYYASSNLFLDSFIYKKIKKKFIIEPYSIKMKNQKINTLKKKERFVLFIGRDTYYKGFYYLEKIIEKCPKVKFVCITDYNFKKNYLNLNKISQLEQKKKYKIIKNCEFLISTSLNEAETFGVSLLEGLTFNKPLMSFDLATGIRKIIVNNKNGFLIKKFDVENYIIKINRLYNNINLIKKFSIYSFLHKKNFQFNYKNINKVFLDLNS